MYERTVEGAGAIVSSPPIKARGPNADNLRDQIAKVLENSHFMRKLCELYPGSWKEISVEREPGSTSLGLVAVHGATLIISGRTAGFVSDRLERELLAESFTPTLPAALFAQAIAATTAALRGITVNSSFEVSKASLHPLDVKLLKEHGGRVENDRLVIDVGPKFLTDSIAKHPDLIVEAARDARAGAYVELRKEEVTDDAVLQWLSAEAVYAAIREKCAETHGGRFATDDFDDLSTASRDRVCTNLDTERREEARLILTGRRAVSDLLQPLHNALSTFVPRLSEFRERMAIGARPTEEAANASLQMVRGWREFYLTAPVTPRAVEVDTLVEECMPFFVHVALTAQRLRNDSIELQPEETDRVSWLARSLLEAFPAADTLASLWKMDWTESINMFGHIADFGHTVATVERAPVRHMLDLFLVETRDTLRRWVEFELSGAQLDAQRTERLDSAAKQLQLLKGVVPYGIT